MRIHHTTSLLALALTAACSAADAQQGYGYPQQSGPAAPSTIPGRGDSEARVPVVDPAQVAIPKPRKPKPQPQPSPWGGTTPSKPAIPPVASQPPVVSQPNNTPPSNGPQAGANDRLTGAYRGVPKTSAVVRGGAAQTSGSVASASVQNTTSTVLACTHNGNTPKITRIRPANESSLQPGGAFIVEGLCFGDAPGKVQVTLPTQYGRIQANEAQVLGWAGDKILAQLPAGVTKATPGDASVEIVSVAGTRGAGKDIGFEPRWEKTRLKGVDASVSTCQIPNTPSTYHDCVTRDEGSGLVLKASHWRGDPDLHNIRAGRDRYDLKAPSWMRPAGCSMTMRNHSDTARAEVRYESTSVVVEWSFTQEADSDSSFNYDVECQVWVPAGVVLQ